MTDKSQQILETTTSTLNLCDKIEKSQRKHRIKKIFPNILNWLRGNGKQKNTSGKLPS